MYRKKDFVGKKVLIICNSIGKSIKHAYCSYILGKITDYNPVTNKIWIIRHVGHIGSPVDFKLNNKDPFDYHYFYDSRLAYKDPEDYNELWWYIAFDSKEAIKLLKNNLLDVNKNAPVFSYHYLSTTCYGKCRSKKEYLTYLLNELSNEVSE